MAVAIDASLSRTVGYGFVCTLPWRQAGLSPRAGRRHRERGAMGQTGAARSRVVLTTGVVALSPLAGTLAGYFVGGTLSGAWIEAVLAFAAAGFLYMAAEELLKEAHEVPEPRLSTTLFFAAFLAVLLIDMISTARG